MHLSTHIKPLLLLAATSLFGLTTSHAAPPLNDSAVKAHEFKTNYQKLTGQNLTLATPAATDPLINGLSVGKTLWYRNPASYNPSQGYWELRLKSSTAAGCACFYTQMDEDNPLSSLAPVGMPFVITPGQTVALSCYYEYRSLVLMVSGVGSYDLTHYHRSSYDFPVFARTLSGNRGTEVGYNVSATLSADEPALPDAAPDVKNTVWFKWTPSFSGAAAVDTNFSTITAEQDRLIHDGVYDEDVHDTVLAVFQGSSPEALALVNWDNNSGWGLNDRVSFTASAGATYYISVSTTASTTSGGFQLNYYQANTPGELYVPYGPTNDGHEVNEGAPSTSVAVRRRYAGNSTTNVTFATVSGGTATSGSDFQALNTTLSFSNPNTFNDIAWEHEVTLNIIDDSAAEASFENVKLELFNPSGGATLDQYNITAFVNIWDDDTLPSSSESGIFLQHQTMRLKENAGDANNMIIRGTAAGAQGIHIIQTPDMGDAVHGQDYRLSFAFLGATDVSAAVPFTIYDDYTFEDEEEVRIYVSPGRFYKIIIEDDDAYLPMAGRLTAALNYGGSKYGNAGVRQAQFFATITATGAMTGRLDMVNQSVPVKAQLDWRGKAMIPIAAKGRPTMMLTLQAIDADGGFRLTLLDAAINRSFETEAVLQNYAAIINPCPEAGRHTCTSSGLSSPLLVSAVSAASIVVDVKGNAIIAGRLFDGTAYTAAGYIDGEGRLSAMAPLFSKAGCLGFSGPLPATDGQTKTLYLTVNRPARAGDSTKLGAIMETIFGYACRYTPPAKGQHVLESWSGGTGKASLYGGPLAMTLDKALTVTTAHVITAPADAQKLQIKPIPGTGMFTGSVILPGTTKALPIFGALYDLPAANGYGHGFFFDGLKGGTIRISKP